MTIKEVERILEIPRATVRYYEKEKLFKPQREKNGYRDYSDEDVELLKKIIVLRKIGISVEDIEALFYGSKTLAEALEDNMVNLQKQMIVCVFYDTQLDSKEHYIYAQKLSDELNIAFR